MPDEDPRQDAWGEFGRQMQGLGESLAAAFRAAWEDEETRQHVQGLQAGLEAMVSEIDQAIEEAAVSPQGQQVHQELRRAADSAREAGKQAWQDARPHVLTAMRRLNVELQKVIDGLEGEQPEAEA